MKKIIELTRRERFAASHRLHSKQLSDDENEKVYGICNNLHGHGHNYELFVTIKSEVDPITGMIINLKDLKKIIRENVIHKFDHKHLDLDCDEFKEIPSTVENISIVIWELLEPHLNGQLYKIKLNETENNYASYYGPSTNS
tara:strand:- start:860 stop:1285 length:426 start_codon:yes stop_codon:yes gene_type:complete